MYVHVCVWVCEFGYVCTHMRLCTPLCPLPQTHQNEFRCVYMSCVHGYTYVYEYVCVHPRAFMCVYVHLCVLVSNILHLISV